MTGTDGVGRLDMDGPVAMAVALLVMGATVSYLLGVMGTGIRREVRESGARPFKDFGLSIVLAVLFIASWLGQGLAQWQEFVDEQAEHSQEASAGDFAAAFTSATLENWQSEFLQLFSFVVLAAVFIHKGSAESKDSDERIEQALSRIEHALAAQPRDPGLGDVRPDPGLRFPLESRSDRAQRSAPPDGAGSASPDHRDHPTGPR